MLFPKEYRANSDDEYDDNIIVKSLDLEKSLSLAEKDFILQGIASGQKEMIPRYLKYIESAEIISHFYSEFTINQEIQNANGEITYIKKNLIFDTIIKSCIENSEFTEVALITISKLLQSESIEILDIVIREIVEINGQSTTFLNELPNLVEQANTDEMKIALIKCISSMKGLIPNIENTFFPFFRTQLQVSEPERKKLVKTAAKYASEIIKNNPLSDFSNEIMASMPFDKEDVELSKYCFIVLEAQIKAGNFDSFDVPQLLDMISQSENELTDYALDVISTAIKYSPTMLPSISDFCSVFPSIISKFHPKSLYLFIKRLTTKSPDFSNLFVEFLDYFAELFSESNARDKPYVVRIICLIILKSHLVQIDNITICENLVDFLLFNSDATTIVIDTLMQLQYFTEEFHDALLGLSESNDELISEYAAKAYEILEERFKLP